MQAQLGPALEVPQLAPAPSPQLAAEHSMFTLMTPLSWKDMSPRVRVFAEYATFSSKVLMLSPLNAPLSTEIEAGPKSMQSPVTGCPFLLFFSTFSVTERHTAREGAIKHAKLMAQINDETR